MAERRMFSKSIIDTDAFLDMPASSQNLYFHLAMRADDDGFVDNPRKIQRIVGATDDDLRILIGKRYILAFESGVIVIKHWRLHNYIRKDRYTPTLYKEEKNSLFLKENGAYTDHPIALPEESAPPPELPETQGDDRPSTNGQPTVAHLATQDRLGKDRLGKDRLGIEDSSSSLRSEELVAPEAAATPRQEGIERIPYAKVQKLYNDLCPKMTKCTVMSEARKKAIKARFASGYKLEDFDRLFNLAAQSSFLNGGNKRNFMANFDWLIRDANMAKVLDGNYADRPNGNNSPDGGGFTYDYGDMSGSL